MVLLQWRFKSRGCKIGAIWLPRVIAYLPLAMIVLRGIIISAQGWLVCMAWRCITPLGQYISRSGTIQMRLPKFSSIVSTYHIIIKSPFTFVPDRCHVHIFYPPSVVKAIRRVKDTHLVHLWKALDHLRRLCRNTNQTLWCRTWAISLRNWL